MTLSFISVYSETDHFQLRPESVQRFWLVNWPESCVCNRSSGASHSAVTYWFELEEPVESLGGILLHCYCKGHNQS